MSSALPGNLGHRPEGGVAGRQMREGMSTLRPLWRCSRCGRRFANRNQWHSCGDFSVEAVLDGKSPHAIALYHRFAEAIHEIGPVIIAPTKTRIGFQVRMIFAAVNALTKNYLRAHVVLARRLDSPRFIRIEGHVHHFRISSVEEIDDEVVSWLKEAYSVGKQEHLHPPC